MSLRDLFGSFGSNQGRNNDSDQDGYFLDDDYYDDADDQDGYYYDDEEPAPRTGLFGGRNRRQQPVSSEGSDRQSGGIFGGRNNKVITVQNTPAMQVTMKKPRSPKDAENICEDLLDGKAVVINLEGVASDIAQRIIDITFGAIYAIDGDLQRISNYIVMASPRTVELGGEFAGSIELEDGGSRYSSSYSSRSNLNTSRQQKTGTGYSF